MDNFNLRKYLVENKLENTDPPFSAEKVAKMVEDSFTRTYFHQKPIDNFYYIKYKGIPISPNGKLKTFKTTSAAMGYINSEITWAIKESRETPFYQNYASTLPKEEINQVRELIHQDIEIIPIVR